MKLKFTKMHGAGNDFVVFNGCDQDINLTTAQFRFIADRRFGIGADQILIVEKTEKAGIDFRYRIFNADGGEVEQCGNGARAFARYVTDFKMTSHNPIRVETKAGIIELFIENNGTVTVNMGKPEFALARIPFDANGLKGTPTGDDTVWPLFLDNESVSQEIDISVVSMGNPHPEYRRGACRFARPSYRKSQTFPEPGQRRFHGNRKPPLDQTPRFRKRCR